MVLTQSHGPLDLDLEVRDRKRPRDLKSEKDSTKGRHAIAGFEDARAKKQRNAAVSRTAESRTPGDSQSGNRDLSPPAARHWISRQHECTRIRALSCRCEHSPNDTLIQPCETLSRELGCSQTPDPQNLGYNTGCCFKVLNCYSA